MTTLPALAERRAEAVARYELASDLENSNDKMERAAFRSARKSYLKAEEAYSAALAKRVAELESLLREAEAFCPRNPPEKTPLLGNRIEQALIIEAKRSTP